MGGTGPSAFSALCITLTSLAKNRIESADLSPSPSLSLTVIICRAWMVLNSCFIRCSISLRCFTLVQCQNLRLVMILWRPADDNVYHIIHLSWSQGCANQVKYNKMPHSYMYHTCNQHKGFIRHCGAMTENERERGTNTVKTMHYLPRKFCSSAPEGMLFWKSIFLPRVSSSNIMRWPLNKAPKPKHSGKHSHTKVISLTGVNHSGWFKKKKRRRRIKKEGKNKRNWRHMNACLWTVDCWGTWNLT